MKNHLVFVYGTLRKHEPNAHYLDHARLVARQSWTHGELYRTESYFPALKPSEQNIAYGELYEVSDTLLKRLDELEGYNEEEEHNLYSRKIQTVYTDMGAYQSNVYFIHPDCEHMLTTPVSFSDWKIDRLWNEKPHFYYFAYGSCMDHERFQQAGVDHYFRDIIGCGVLHNYSLAFSYHKSDGGRADIIEGEGYVEGIVYKLPFEAHEYLFQREGVHGGVYRTTFVDLICEGKSLNDVLTFTVTDKQKDQAPPLHYAREIYRGAKGFVSQSYLKHLEHKFIDEFQIEGMKAFIDRES